MRPKTPAGAAARTRATVPRTKTKKAAEAEAVPERFRPFTGADLAEPALPVQWLIRGVWPVGPYGPLGGAKKTLKTYIASVLAIAVAAGVPAFNNPEWAVPEPRPVIYYGGEGGIEMHRRRLQRIARDVYGIDDLSALPFWVVTDVGPFDGREFREALRRNISDMEKLHGPVGLVVLDSLYNYHPADIEVSNLYERGRLLGGLSASLVADEVALWLVDHFNKTGSGIDLDRLAQSGMSAWADSWMLFEHAKDADVANGSFSISTGIGSRQWGGEEWTLDINIGPFDKESSGYLTTMKVEAHEGITKRRNGVGERPRAGDTDIRAAILASIDANGDQSQDGVVVGVMKECAVGKARAKKQFDALADEGRIHEVKRTRVEGGREVTRRTWTTAPVRVQRATRLAPDAEARKSPPKRNPTRNPTRPPHRKAKRP